LSARQQKGLRCISNSNILLLYQTKRKYSFKALINKKDEEEDECVYDKEGDEEEYKDEEEDKDKD